jgi:hypothetical protein
MLGLPAAAAAQRACLPGPNSNEARTLARSSVPLAFSAAGAPESFRVFQVGVEVASVPSIDPATATPTVCRPGKGPENTNLLPVFPRPRVTLSMPGRLTLEASWIPPVPVNGVRANLFGLALGKSFGQPDGIVLAIRGDATFGSINAPITCGDRALADPSSECYRGQRSDDRFQPNIFGADFTFSAPLVRGRLRPYVGAGYNNLRPRLQVHFVNQFGELDNTSVEVSLNRVSVFGGATWAATARFSVSGELYTVPADGMSGRLVVRTALGQ